MVVDFEIYNFKSSFSNILDFFNDETKNNKNN